jgi:hypothetical protein
MVSVVPTSVLHRSIDRNITEPRGRNEGHTIAHDDARFAVVDGQDFGCREDSDMRFGGEHAQHGADICTVDADQANDECIALTRCVGGGTTVHRHSAAENRPVDAELIGAAQRYFRDSHLEQHLRWTRIQRLNCFLQQREIRRRRADHERIGGWIGHNGRAADQVTLSGCITRGNRNHDHIGPNAESLGFAFTEVIEVARETPVVQRLRARAAHGNAKELTQRGSQVFRVGVFERHDVGAQPRLTLRSLIEFPDQLLVARNVRAIVLNELSVGALDRLDARARAGHLLERGAASSALIDCSGTSCVTRPSGAGVLTSAP